MSPYWEHFEHEVDMGIHGIVPTLNQAFEQAVLSMTAVITDPAHILPSEAIRIHCTGRQRISVSGLDQRTGMHYGG